MTLDNIDADDATLTALVVDALDVRRVPSTTAAAADTFAFAATTRGGVSAEFGVTRDGDGRVRRARGWLHCASAAQWQAARRRLAAAALGVGAALVEDDVAAADARLADTHVAGALRRRALAAWRAALASALGGSKHAAHSARAVTAAWRAEADAIAAAAAAGPLNVVK